MQFLLWPTSCTGEHDNVTAFTLLRITTLYKNTKFRSTGPAKRKQVAP